MHWRILGHEGLAKRDVALWLSNDALSIEYAGEPLSRYEVEYRPGSGGLRQVRRPELFETVHVLPQPRLFGLEGYAPRSPRRSEALQQALFSYHDAWG